jgi:phosphotransferase system HPr (HPr) family protein
MAVDAKSLLSILDIGVMQHDRILIACEGADEAAALEALAGSVENNFGEGEG